MATRSARYRRGQALPEFALVLGIMMLTFMALFDLGRAVGLSNSLSNAAREGARFAIVNQDTASVTQRVEGLTFLGDVTNAGDASLIGYFRPNDDGTVSSVVCEPITIGCIAVVNPQSSWSAITPLLGDVIGPITLEARSELPVEFVCPNPAISAFDTVDKCPKQP